MDTKVLIIVCFGFLLHSRESLSQVIFPDVSATTQPSTITTSNILVSIQSNVCICVNPGRCFSASSPTDGSGQIDIRIVSTATGTATGSVTPITSSASTGITTIVASQSSCLTNLQLCCPSTPFSCGLRYSPYPSAQTPTGAQAHFGAYPWQAIILTSGNLYVGSGVLIDHMHVLTVAHKVNSFLTNGAQLKIRMGEWDAQSTSEPIPYQEYTVSRIFVHPQYASASLINSVAILRLTPIVPLGQYPTITTACLSTAQISGLRCWVSGWGAQNFVSGATQAIQTQVDVPIVDQATCQTKLRTTKLGSGFVLDNNSFMCAGGEPGKDACTGDGGSPLVCPIAGKWYVVGLVAWGIGCGTTDIPGVYINVTNYISWIQSTTMQP